MLAVIPWAASAGFGYNNVIFSLYIYIYMYMCVEYIYA
jgi:hypothetical protein